MDNGHVIRQQINVINALIVRDVTSRFGSSVAFVLAIAWPLAHIWILVGLNSIGNRAVPFGESSVLWYAVGMVPFIIFSYTSRMIVIGMVMNKPLLSFPRIKITDILISRSIIEALVSAIVVMVLIVILTIMKVDYWPWRPAEAFLAICCAFMMGVGYGTINGLLAMAFHQWATVYNLFIIVLWISSGVLFLPNIMPEEIRKLLYFHPTIHPLELLRGSVYDGYSSLILDVKFMIFGSVLCLVSGLLLERIVRGRLLMS
jgi:capsular polysaccharide transport system permease protein